MSPVTVDGRYPNEPDHKDDISQHYGCKGKKNVGDMCITLGNVLFNLL